MHSPLCACADMGEARDPRLGVADERNGAPDVAQRPQCERELEHCCDAGVLAEAKSQIVVAAGLEEGQRVFQVLSRFAKLSGEPTRGSRCAVGDSGLLGIGSRLDVAEEGLGVHPHRHQLAAHEASDPQAIVGRQPFRRVLVAKRRLAGLGEGFRRLRRARPSSREKRIAISGAQVRPLG